MELPNYRMPVPKNVAHLLWDKAKDFLQRAFTVIFLATIVVWFLQTFDFHLNVVADSQDSILATIAGLLTPPSLLLLGFGDWRVSTALIAGFMAKESVVSTLSVLFHGTETLLMTLTPLVAPPFWCSVCYTPCVAAIASIKRELGGKWALGVVIGQCVIAWICALFVRVIGLLLGGERMNLPSILLLIAVIACGDCLPSGSFCGKESRAVLAAPAVTVQPAPRKTISLHAP